MINCSASPSTTPPFWQIISHHQIFCGFDIKPNAKDPSKMDKLPKAMDRMTGVKENASIDKLGTYQQAKDLGYPFVGISFTRPILLMAGKHLVCVDIDWKNAPDGKAHPKQLELMSILAGHAYETSLSGQGAHYWVLCNKDQIPASITLSKYHEIEIFAGVKPGRQMNVLLTDYNASGELQSIYLKEEFEKLAIVPYKDPIAEKTQKEVLYTANLSDIGRALSYVSSDKYDTWIKVGMVLKDELGEDGLALWDNWSQTSDKYDPTDTIFKWGSFKGQGLTAGTLFKMAQDNGFSQFAHSTPEEDFGTVDPETGEIIAVQKVSLLDLAAIDKTNGLQAPQWVIDGVIPNGVGVIAGVGGVGKTTAIMPLVAMVAGFDDHLSNISVKINRHVLYITEDSVQAQKAIYAIKKWRKSSKDVQAIEDYVHLYNSKQYGINELYQLLTEAVERYSMEFRGVMFAPLVVFDTAAANIRVENENDNAEIAKYMTMFKQLWARYYMPIWLVNHLAKSANGLAIDELEMHSARGASAWRDNSNWTANLAIAKDSQDRILQMMKVREELDFNEIIFTSVVHEEMVNDVFGDPVLVKYRFCTAAKSSKGARAYKHIKGKEEAILKAVVATAYPSKNMIKEQVSGSKDVVFQLIDSMVEKGTLKILPLPDDVKRRNQDSFYCGIP